MDVIVTRYIGITGTAILAEEFKEGLLGRYPEWLVREARSFNEGIDELEQNDTDVIESLSDTGIRYSAAYHEFGIFEALFQMSKTLRCGLDIMIKNIPIKQETVEVCEFTGADPYLLYSGGSFVIACDDADRTVSELEAKGIPAFFVGKTTSTNDKLVINGDEKGFLPHVRKDELKRILGRKVYNERTDIIRN
ncbi:MAG: hypothetical protein K5888_09945 [Lachnospiraceae bacterium]|nr:hypothetical protein [Lachnospiraceae bacterium]